MGRLNRDDLKTRFESGDKLTARSFIDLIDV